MTHSAHASNLLNHQGGPAPGTEGTRFGFFTDTSICIGCKACEVACKEWNQVPAREESGFTGHSLDNTGALGADSWRHVAFIEQPAGRVGSGGPEPGPVGTGRMGLEWFGEDADPPPVFPGEPAPAGEAGFRWLLSSDVCKHCTEPGCLEVCPTGAIFRTEFETIVVQDDVCNGCGYCVTACPYGVIERRSHSQPGGGGAFKCTLCYDRLRGHLQPACAQACPTDSIQFGPLEELRERAKERARTLEDAGVPGVQLYGADPGDGVGGNGAFFLLLDDPEVYGFPPDPVTPTRNLPEIWRWAGMAALGLVAGIASVFAGGRSPGTGERRGLGSGGRRGQRR